MSGNAPALEKGLRILEYILAANETVSLSQIAESVGYKVSEIQRMVNFLDKDGFLVRTVSGAYAPGARAYSLADRKLDSAVIARSEGPMRRFSMCAGLSVHLGLLVEDQLHVVYEVEGTGDVRVGVRPGLYDIARTASGLLLAAYRWMGTEQDTDAYAVIRRQGFSYIELACAIGVHVLAVPVSLGPDPCVASLASPYFLVSKDQAPVRMDLVENLQRASAEISARF
jgi:DNA-binding IclR family transcriptional regulator